jgi:hypothetical protein
MTRIPVVRRGRSPWTEMNRLQREMETLFGGLARRTCGRRRWMWRRRRTI